METYEAYLEVKESQIPNAGKGLFTTVSIKKGEKIVEYTGAISSWKDADHMDGDNPFIFYVNEDYVIDASKNEKSLAKYANDAWGITHIKGTSNNAEFMEEELRVFIIARKNIAAGKEIFVDYGPDYWETVKDNIKIDEATEAKKKKKK